MHIARIVTKRPVAVVMFYLGILLLGAVSLGRLSVDLLPDMSYPKLTVRTLFRDAVPEEVERIITEPIEQLVATVPGIRNIKSVSREGISVVVLEFGWGVNMDFAALNVREKLDGLGRNLPDEADKPVIMRMDPGSRPIMSLSVSGGDLAHLKELSENVFKRRMEQINGVAMAEVVGGEDREIHVEIDRRKAEALGLTIENISNAIKAANIDMPGGTLLRGRYRFSLRTLGAFQNLDDIRNVVIRRNKDNSVLYLKDAATVAMGFREKENITKYNQEESIGLLLYKDSGSNTVQVSARVREILEEIKEHYPAVSLIIAHDQAEFISLAISNVLHAIAMGGILAFLILFFFLHDLRNPLSISAAIPISIIATFILLYFSGTTLNLMSLGGLALGVGMLVDCSIVVLENIFRHREEGLSAAEASVRGTSEVAMAVAASTFTTIAVFLPVIYVRGIAGQLFRDQALTVTFSLSASLLVSLTLLPVLASRFGGKIIKKASIADFDFDSETLPLDRRRPFKWIFFPFRILIVAVFAAIIWIVKTVLFVFKQILNAAGRLLSALFKPVFNRFDRMIEKCLQGYLALLNKALDNRLKALGIMILTILLTAMAAMRLPRQLIPDVDQGEFSIHAVLPPETSLEYTAEWTAAMEKALLSEKAVKDVFSGIGIVQQYSGTRIEETGLNHSEIRVRLNEGYKTSDIISRFRKRSDLTAGVQLSFQTGETVLGGMLGSDEKDVVIRIISESAHEIPALVESVREKAALSGLTDISDNMETGRPEYRIYIDREKAALFGLSVYQISQFLQNQLRGRIATEYKEFDQKIPLRVRPAEHRTQTIEGLLNTFITSGQKMAPVRELIQIRQESGVTAVHRENQTRVASVLGNITGGSLGHAVQALEKTLSGLTLDDQTRIIVGGAREEMNESYRSLGFAGLLAVALVYMIMAAQFESLLHPLIIMLSIPLALTGTVWLLLITGQSVNVIALTGVVVLIGIAVNDAIVKVDFINQSRRSGMAVREALLAAGSKRFRPIVMTSVTTILGLMPLAIGMGQGAELQRPLALAIIGGLFTATVLTLIMIPVIYSLTARETSQKTE